MKLHFVAAAFLITGLIAAPVPVQAQETHSFEGLVCAGGSNEDGWCEWGSLPGVTIDIHKDGNVLGFGAVDESAETGKDGTFAFSGLEEGTYQFSLSRDGFEPITEPVEVGAESSRTFGLHGALVDVSGFVESEDGAVGGAVVSFMADEYHQTESDNSGNFALQLTAGYFTIQAEHKEYRGVSQWQLVDGSAVVSVVMESAPGRDVEIKGVVVDQNGDAIPDVRVNLNQCCGDYEYESYDEKPREESSSGGDGSSGTATTEPYPYYDSYQETVTDANGAFSFFAYEGYYDLNFYKDGYAQVWQSGDTAQDNTIEVEMEKFPEKTVTIKGKILGEDGKGLSAASISISNEKYGQYECTTYEEDAQGEDGDMVQDVYYGGYYGCSVVMKDDGSFEGKVMPGYSIISIYYDHWRTCDHSGSSDGSSSTTCGTNYYSASLVRNFQADTEYDLTTRLVARPGPDAEVNGYVLTEGEKGILNAQINFNRLDGYSYAWAQVDEHGSYRLALVSGHYSVSVYADGYFRWEGNVEIKAGSVTPFDVTLTEGQSRYGHCCYHDAYAEDSASLDGGVPTASPGGQPSGYQSSSAGGSGANSGEGSGESVFEDLGGLGPYDKEARADNVEASNDTPPVALVVACVGLLGFALLRRR